MVVALVVETLSPFGGRGVGAGGWKDILILEEALGGKVLQNLYEISPASYIAHPVRSWLPTG